MSSNKTQCCAEGGCLERGRPELLASKAVDEEMASWRKPSSSLWSSVLQSWAWLVTLTGLWWLDPSLAAGFHQARRAVTSCGGKGQWSGGVSWDIEVNDGFFSSAGVQGLGHHHKQGFSTGAASVQAPHDQLCGSPCLQLHSGGFQRQSCASHIPSLCSLPG